MRLATLGLAWREAGGDAVAIGEHEIPFVAAHYRDLGIEVASGTEAQGDVVVVDSYDPGIRFRHAQPAGPELRVLLDDVGGLVPPGFDVVWNPNPYGGAEHYPGFAGCVVSGPDHLAVRPDLPMWSRQNNEVVVSVGGGEPQTTVWEAFEGLPLLLPNERMAMTGRVVPRGWRQIEPACFWAEASHAKMLVTAAGGTMWEAAAAGIPVVVLQIADNQRFGYRWARDAGVPGINALLVDGDFMAHQLRALIGAARPLPRLTNGAGRVAAVLAQLASSRGRE